MAYLKKLRFLGALPTLKTLGYVAVDTREVPRPARAAVVRITEPAPEPVEVTKDWSDPDLPLADLRAELERRGVEVNSHWNRTTLQKHLDEQ